jgi:hypothetical protein
MHQVDRQAVRFIGPEDQANLAGPHRWRGLVGQHMGDPNPGGAGEVFKGRGQDYKLLWKERLGFARMAIEFGYPIVPFAAVAPRKPTTSSSTSRCRWPRKSQR